MSMVSYISGKILTPDGFQKGFLSLTDDEEIVIEEGSPPVRPVQKGLIIPTVVNAHTHIGDTFVRNRGLELPHDLEQLVAPPHGLKHRLLKSVSNDEIRQGITAGLKEMINGGTYCFCDFREGGKRGAQVLIDQAKKQAITPMIYGRPRLLRFDKNELLNLFPVIDGIGISSISDWEPDELESVIDLAQNHDIPVAFHASERIREDIDQILSYNPAFLIHMIKASKNDFLKVKEHDIPIVICPRSNSFFGQRPPYELMKKTGVDMVLGTDNAMLHSLSILDEIRFIRRDFPKMFSFEDLLLMATYKARKALNLKDGIPGSNFPTSFLVLDVLTGEPIVTSFNG